MPNGSRIFNCATEEMIAVGDVNNDGLPDIAAGLKDGSAANIAWFRNPGDVTGPWQRFPIGKARKPRGVIGADINNDGRMDIIVSEETRSRKPDAHIWWYEQPTDPTDESWMRRAVGHESHLGSRTVDLDGDSDLASSASPGTTTHCCTCSETMRGNGLGKESRRARNCEGRGEESFVLRWNLHLTFIG